MTIVQSPPAALLPDQTPPEGWRTAFGINGWHAARWVTDPDGELRIAYVTAPSWHALLASIAQHEAALAIAAQEWPATRRSHPFDGEPSWAQDIPLASRPALGDLLASAERSFSSLRSSSERTRDDSGQGVAGRAEGAAEMAALACDVDPDPERFLSLRAMNERKRLESARAATALRNGVA